MDHAPNPAPLWLRISTRCGALAVGAALVASLAAIRFEPARGASHNSAGAPSVVMIEFMAQAPRATPPQITRPNPEQSASAPSQSGDGAHSEPFRLWDYSQRGDIVFASEEHLRRCREARMQRTDSSECPDGAEQRALTWDLNRGG